MKTNNITSITLSNKCEMEEIVKETPATSILEETCRKQIFGVVDLWRMQKKHKTLGSSTRW